MEKQNDWIFKRTAFAVVPPPAFEYELFSVYEGIEDVNFCLTNVLHITMSKDVERQIMNLLPGIFLYPFR